MNHKLPPKFLREDHKTFKPKFRSYCHPIKFEIKIVKSLEVK